MTFEYEDSGIKESFFGKLKFNVSKQFTLQKFEKLSKLVPKIIDTDTEIMCPECVTILRNGNILVCEFDLIHLLDKDFKVIRKVDQINNDYLDCCASISTNNEDKIYICDYPTHSVKMVDLDFNFIKQYGTGTRVDEREQVSCPYDFCFYKSFSYVCDFFN